MKLARTVTCFGLLALTTATGCGSNSAGIWTHPPILCMSTAFPTVQLLYPIPRTRGVPTTRNIVIYSVSTP
ncbi:MAG: hypothetical protein JO199_05520, partial [Candidatus Eremiobacteraeota bacterium]|nr:hypothetical protein [Candidatus Eremiobacteraeota bacterium]